MDKIILCHKCGGVLTNNGEGLYGCDCISGYVRGFEPHLTKEEARVIQIKKLQQRKELYIYQKRSKEMIDLCDKMITQLNS